MIRIPFFRPSCSTISPVAGTVRFLRGGMLIPARTLGGSLGVPSVPCTARPFRSSGEALSIRIL